MGNLNERQFGTSGHVARFDEANKSQPGRYGVQHMQNGLTNVHDRKSGLTALYDSSTGAHHSGPALHRGR